MRTPEADRFRHECEVPDPPLSPKGRQRYWDETVFEAVAELRKRLRSQDSEEALHALEMILDLEKTRIRHASKVSGTHVPNLPDLEDDWGRPVPTVPEKKTSPPVPLSMNGEGVFKAETVQGSRDQSGVPVGRPLPVTPLNTPSPFMERGTGGEVFPKPNPPRIPGVTGVFSDRDDDWTRDPGRCRLDDDFASEPVAAPFALPPPEPRIWC